MEEASGRFPDVPPFLAGFSGTALGVERIEPSTLIENRWWGGAGGSAPSTVDTVFLSHPASCPEWPMGLQDPSAPTHAHPEALTPTPLPLTDS